MFLERSWTKSWEVTCRSWLEMTNLFTVFALPLPHFASPWGAFRALCAKWRSRSYAVSDSTAALKISTIKKTCCSTNYYLVVLLSYLTVVWLVIIIWRSDCVLCHLEIRFVICEWLGSFWEIVQRLPANKISLSKSITTMENSENVISTCPWMMWGSGWMKIWCR